MAKQFKNVNDLIKGLSEDENFKKEALKTISENGLSKFLSFLRCGHQMTQKELAEKIGCSQGRVSKIESAKDDKLSIKDFIDYGNALGLELEIGFRRKDMKWVDMVKYHAFQMQGYLNNIVQVAKEDEALEEGALAFCFETLKNVPVLILNAMSKLPNARFNKLIDGSKSKVHISGPIQSNADENNEAMKFV
ncbi:MAG: helix-turn-helix domain-containing protein [Candidatus Omnitrophota bacterium]